MRTNVANAVRSVSSWWHGAVQSVVFRQDWTLKPLATLLYVTVCPIICFGGIESL